MFDIGPTELIVIFVVALLVIGPERLPGTVRTVSLWIGRFRRSFQKIKADVERELNADEIKRQLHNETILAELNEAKTKANDLAKDMEKIVHEAEETVQPDSTSNTEQDSGNTEGKETQSSDQIKKPNDKTTTDSSVSQEVRQAVSYVNDISREVKSDTQEIKTELSSIDPTSKPKQDDKE